MPIDRDAPLRFLRTAFLPDDWIAVLLKRHDTGEVVQRVGPVGMVLDPHFQSWLRFKNARRFNVYVSVNALTPGRRSRTRDSVTAVRHLFLDADRDTARVMSVIEHRSDLPAPSFIVRSSEGRAHVLWRVRGLSANRAEALQRHLARELGTDTAATSAAQLTRLPGFLNHKYSRPPLVLTNGERPAAVYGSECFPDCGAFPSEVLAPRKTWRGADLPMVERARRYVAATPPAVQGQHGDLATFRLCCRLIGRFELPEHEALAVLSTWNAHCRPPWTDRELLVKLHSARRHFHLLRRS